MLLSNFGKKLRLDIFWLWSIKNIIFGSPSWDSLCLVLIEKIQKKVFIPYHVNLFSKIIFVEFLNVNFSSVISQFGGTRYRKCNQGVPKIRFVEWGQKFHLFVCCKNCQSLTWILSSIMVTSHNCLLESIELANFTFWSPQIWKKYGKNVNAIDDWCWIRNWCCPKMRKKLSGENCLI